MNDRISNVVSNVGDGSNIGWPMSFQHANDITQVEEPSSTTVLKMFRFNDFVVYTTTI
jgi:hypothetical protein